MSWHCVVCRKSCSQSDGRDGADGAGSQPGSVASGSFNVRTTEPSPDHDELLASRTARFFARLTRPMMEVCCSQRLPRWRTPLATRWKTAGSLRSSRRSLGWPCLRGCQSRCSEPCSCAQRRGRFALVAAPGLPRPPGAQQASLRQQTCTQAHPLAPRPLRPPVAPFAVASRFAFLAVARAVVGDASRWGCAQQRPSLESSSHGPALASSVSFRPQPWPSSLLEPRLCKVSRVRSLLAGSALGMA